MITVPFILTVALGTQPSPWKLRFAHGQQLENRAHPQVEEKREAQGVGRDERQVTQQVRGRQRCLALSFLLSQAL